MLKKRPRGQLCKRLAGPIWSPSNLDTPLENLHLERFGLVLKRVSPLLVITQAQLTAIFHAWHGSSAKTKAPRCLCPMSGGANSSKYAGRYSTVHSTVQYSTVQYCTVQYCTVQYCTVLRVCPVLYIVQLQQQIWRGGSQTPWRGGSQTPWSLD